MIAHPTIPFSYNLMAKPVGASCNLQCDYCYYNSRSTGQTGEPARMENSILEEFIKQYIQTQLSPTVVFCWQGGEPLLAGLSYFEKAIRLQKKYAGDKKIENSIQTNGSLITEDWCRFFKRHDFLVGISVDGPREVHDFHRTDLEDSGSWERTMRGLSLIRDYGISFNTLTAVNSHTALYAEEIYQFLKGLGSRYQQYSPVVERYYRDGELDLSPWSVSPDAYGQFLCTVFDLWIREDVGDFFIQQFEASLASWLGEDPGLCLNRSTCGKALMIEKNGDVYACDHFGFPEFKRGNLKDRLLSALVSSEEQLEFGLSKFTSLPGTCRACGFLFACYGECPRNRFEVSEKGERGVNYLCEGLKHYYKHISPYMDYMAEQIRLGKSPLTVKDYMNE